jgi:beta-glucanase (GH16 family)
MDIAEEQGADPGIINSTAHSYATLNEGGNPNGVKTELADSEDAFHTYGAEWNEDKIVFTIDGAVTNEVTIEREADGSFDPAKAPWAHDFHLVINLAMGGNWAQDVAKRKGLDLPNGIDDSQEANWKFLIKDVKYYKLAAAQ